MLMHSGLLATLLHLCMPPTPFTAWQTAPLPPVPRRLLTVADCVHAVWADASNHVQLLSNELPVNQERVTSQRPRAQGKRCHTRHEVAQAHVVALPSCCMGHEPVAP